MTKKNQKIIEKRIEEILEDCLEWYEIPGQPGVGDNDFNFELATKKLKSFISDILREIVGEDTGAYRFYDTDKIGLRWDSKEVVEGELKAEGYNRAKQEIRQRARKLGLEV